MIPVIALIGRTNVGKSTLFNYLTRSRSALVADFPGLTRDRLYGMAEWAEHKFIVVDTGGIGDDSSELTEQVTQQAEQAIQEADAILFMVDGRSGVTAADIELVDRLRLLIKPVLLVVNKTEGGDPEIARADFYQLGLGEPIPIAAAHGRGVAGLLTRLFAQLPAEIQERPSSWVEPKGIKVALLGRPNVGKSTLFNRMLGEERAVVYDAPGTTRDSLYLPVRHHGKDYVLIDTAGIRRKAKVTETIEKFSVLKALQAMSLAHVVILVIDARVGLHKQELSLLDAILADGRSVVIAVNKWDNLAQEQKEKVREEITSRLGFADFVRVYFISALHGTNVGHLFDAVDEAYQSALCPMPTARLNELLAQAVYQNPPPLVRGRRIKLRYAHSGGHNPPVIVIHGSQMDKLPAAYVRYLMHFFREQFGLVGTPLRIELRAGDNPYADKKNELTERQRRKRKRLLQYVKRKG